jgi:hypothetical protein
MLASAERDRLSGRSTRHSGNDRDEKDLRGRAARGFGWRFEYKDMPKPVRGGEGRIAGTIALSEPGREGIMGQSDP